MPARRDHPLRHSDLSLELFARSHLVVVAHSARWRACELPSSADHARTRTPNDGAVAGRSQGCRRGLTRPMPAMGAAPRQRRSTERAVSHCPNDAGVTLKPGVRNRRPGWRDWTTNGAVRLAAWLSTPAKDGTDVWVTSRRRRAGLQSSRHGGARCSIPGATG